jgi:hypothetical protein
LSWPAAEFNLLLVIKFSKFVVIEINGHRANVNCTLPEVVISKIATVIMNISVVFSVFLVKVFSNVIYIGCVWSLVESVEIVTVPQPECLCGCCLTETDDVRKTVVFVFCFYRYLLETCKQLLEKRK